MIDSHLCAALSLGVKGKRLVSPAHTNAKRLYKWALRALHHKPTPVKKSINLTKLEASMARTIDQQIAETQAKLARLKQKQKASETRRKIIVGSVVISSAIKDPEKARALAALLRRTVTRDVDKKEIIDLLKELDTAATQAKHT